MRNEKGQFIKGIHSSPATEFKPGQHWRPHKPFREREYLLKEYVEKQRSTGDICQEWGVRESAIIFWLNKHDIPRRSISEARKAKHWGSSGEANAMFGKRGDECPNWKGGVTPERQLFYSSIPWKLAEKLVWARDERKCQRCHKGEGECLRLEIHHIVKFEVERLRAEPTNLVLLCSKCHGWVHSRKNADKAFIREEVVYMEEGVTLLQGDCRERMAELEPESVHMICTSPPY